MLFTFSQNNKVTKIEPRAAESRKKMKFCLNGFWKMQKSYLNYLFSQNCDE